MNERIIALETKVEKLTDLLTILVAVIDESDAIDLESELKNLSNSADENFNDLNDYLVESLG